MRTIFITLALLLCAISLSAQKQPRLKENFDFDWKFAISDEPGYSNPGYADSHWDDVQLPHDWNITMPYDRNVGGSPGFMPESVGWYRKTFDLPAGYKGKAISILFDGIFHQSDVYINGHHLGFRPYGFCSIEYDLTPYLRFGESNTIAVRVDCTGDRPRWYAGSGIYRHAWLQVVNPLHIATYGTYITTPTVDDAKAELQITTTLKNDTPKEQTITLSHRVLDAAGKQVAKGRDEKTTVAANGTIDITQRFDLKQPMRWSIDTPYIYSMETTVRAGGKVTDVYTTPFGVRTFEFDKDRGFLLNGEHVKLQGLCLHEDAGSLGVAVPDRANERRLEILKEYGCNAIRCAHNPFSPEFMEMCDRMGFVVIAEAFDKWKSGYYEKYFDEWWQRDLENMILRDRNHPSIALWSIGNEVQEAWDTTNTGAERAAMLQDFVHRLEPTRPVTLAAQNNHQTHFAGVVDVIGYNYLEARMISEKQKYPERIVLVSEELPYFRGEEGRIRSYTPLNPWELVAKHDFVVGGFIWSGVDYLGEAAQWPSKGWPNGLFDITMTEKPRAAYHRAMWNKEPMVRIAVIDQSLDIDHGRDLWQWPKMAAHWNFPHSYMGLIMEVRTTTNCESVEMYLNNQLMGRQNTADFTNNTIVWYLPYTPGTLEAKGYNGNEQVAQYQLVTSKGTTAAIIKADRSTLKADGQDLSHITILLVDADGNPVQTDDRRVTVTVTGEGRLRGVDNGDLRRETSFGGNELNTYFGRALAIVQSGRKPGKIRVTIKVEGIDEVYVMEVVNEGRNS